MRMAVVGGTGLVGAMVVDEVTRAGHVPVVVARSTGVDVTTGVGLDAALDGVDVVIDVSNRSTQSRKVAVTFFGAATRHLLDAGRKAGVQHHVVLSIVGIDRVEFGYYVGKLRQEQLVHEGPVPWTVLRATQFHEFAGQLLDRGRGPIAVVPRMRIQPVAAREVAGHLVRLAEQGPSGQAPELAGPEIHELTDLARAVLRARGSHRLLVPVRLPGKVGRAMTTDGQLPAGPALHGTQTFDDWLAGSRTRQLQR